MPICKFSLLNRQKRKIIDYVYCLQGYGKVEPLEYTVTIAEISTDVLIIGSTIKRPSDSNTREGEIKGKYNILIQDLILLLST
jgi:hypothetical protein